MQATPVVNMSRERRENRAKAIAELRGQMFVALALCIVALIAIALAVDAAGITTAIARQWSLLCAAITLENVRPLLDKAFLLAGAFTVLSSVTAALSFVPVLRWMRKASAALACGAVGLIWFSFTLFEILSIFVTGNGAAHGCVFSIGIVLLGFLFGQGELKLSAGELRACVAPASLGVFGVFALLEYFTGESSAHFMPGGASWLGLLMFGLFCVRGATIATLEAYAKRERGIDADESGRASAPQTDDLSDSEPGPEKSPQHAEIGGNAAAETSVTAPPDTPSAS